MVAKEQMLDGQYRQAHQTIVSHSEEIGSSSVSPHCLSVIIHMNLIEIIVLHNLIHIVNREGIFYFNSKLFSQEFNVGVKEAAGHCQ